MLNRLAVPTRRIRIFFQFFFFALWVALIYVTKHPIDSWLAAQVPVSFFLRIDPLVLTVVSGGMRMAVTITFLGFVTLAISLLLGRVFCGWVCPLGSIFDFYGWFLRRLRFRFEGPSPPWFTLKYYLLAIILIFSLFGAVSPLMGFDPIVLLTRVAATIFNPLFNLRGTDRLIWSEGDPLGNYGSFIDFGTLILFIAIMGSTTKLSRIWCRTACPLGAYLAVLSRNSVLRRDTKDCVHCNICSNHCPTGAISFTNAEVYNESECIKCFACSQECPVDANFFTLKWPLPAVQYAQKPVSLERRTLLTTGVMAAVAAPLLRLSGGKPNSQKTLMRPPMSRTEDDFLRSCIRCTECIKACPTGILKTADSQFGLRAFWSPVMVPVEGVCLPGCSACSQACPTDAIMKYPVDRKYDFKVGTAKLEPSRCISYTENKFCSECIRVCPTDAFVLEKGWQPPGEWFSLKASDTPAPKGKIPTRPKEVSYSRCVGCGACEHACNQIVSGQPAMITEANGRAVPTELTKEDKSLWKSRDNWSG